MKHINITIINDCKDGNAVGRQFVRASALMGGHVSFVGVSSDLEAAGNLIDVLDAYGEAPGVVLVNVAPRNGSAKRFTNGTPFCYFRYKNILVVSSFDGLTLSLVKKLGLTDMLHVLDIPTVVAQWVREGVCTEELATHITETQFRSYEFLPRVASYILTHGDAPAEKVSINEVHDAPQAVWWVDNFGNCKTTLITDEVSHTAVVETSFGALPYYEHLREVPDGETALVAGSSGVGERRFIEIVAQGGNVAQRLSIASGAKIL